MWLALLASRNRTLYRTYVASLDDIAELVCGPHIEALSVGPYDVWLTPSLRPGNWQPNGPATRLLLALSDTFTARTVPVLRGDIVVTARDSFGGLAALDDSAVERLADLVDTLPFLSEHVVQCRIRRIERELVRRRRREQSGQSRLSWTPLPHPEA